MAGGGPETLGGTRPVADLIVCDELRATCRSLR